MPQRSEPGPGAVPLDVAYTAMRDRAHRLMDALAQTEAELIYARRQLTDARTENEGLREELGAKQGGGEDAESADPPGYTAAVGQAD